jgi:glycerol 2-dehydrogenase (NADP+)
VATILLSYQVNRGCVVLPKSVTEKRITDNLRIIDLDADDVKAIDAMAADGKQQRVNTPKWGWDLGFDDWYGPKKEAQGAAAA